MHFQILLIEASLGTNNEICGYDNAKALFETVLLVAERHNHQFLQSVCSYMPMSAISIPGHRKNSVMCPFECNFENLNEFLSDMRMATI